MCCPIRLCLAIAVLASVGGCAQTSTLSGGFPWMRSPTPVAETKDESKGDAGTAKVVADEKPTDDKTVDDKTKAAPAPEKTAEAKPAAETPAAATPAEEPAAEKPADGDAAGAKSDAATDAKPADGAAANGDAKAAAGETLHDAATLTLIDEELKLASPAEREVLFAEWKSLDSAMVQQVIRIRRMVRELDSSSPAAAETTAAATDAFPGTANPWGVNANAASAPAVAHEPAARLPLSTLPGRQLAQASAAESTASYGQMMQVAAVEAAAAVKDTEGAPAAPPAAAAPMPVETSPEWKAQLDAMLVAANARAEQARIAYLGADGKKPSTSPTARRQYVESQVQLRLLYLMAGDQARAMQVIPGLEASDQQFWQQVLWGVSTYFDEAAMPERAERMTQTVEQLRAAITRLQSEANLQLRNVAFCRKITSFGNFERFERDDYSPGQRVLLYAEVVNFQSTPQPADGLFRTQLKSTVEILRSGQSQPLTKIEFDPTIDLCRSYRQDYFHSYELKIPEELSVAAYVLKLTVTDAQSGKVATYTVNFTVK